MCVCVGLINKLKRERDYVEETYKFRQEEINSLSQLF